MRGRAQVIVRSGLTLIALLSDLVEKFGCRGIGACRARQGAVDVVGPLVDRRRDAGEPCQELVRSGSVNSEATSGRSCTARGWSSPTMEVSSRALRIPSFEEKSRYTVADGTSECSLIASTVVAA